MFLMFGEDIIPVRDGGWHCPAADRNRRPISEVLAGLLPETGLVLEVGSGTGQHIEYLAPRFPRLRWQPSDPDPEMRRAIMIRLENLAYENVELPPLELDARAEWPQGPVDVVMAVNLLHIAPAEVTSALFRGAAKILRIPGLLFIYGPFKRGGEHTAVSNARFDALLRRRNPGWGVREMEWVVEEAERAGFVLRRVVPMPANNLSLIFDLRLNRPA